MFILNKNTIDEALISRYVIIICGQISKKDTEIIRKKLKLYKKYKVNVLICDDIADGIKSEFGITNEKFIVFKRGIVVSKKSNENLFNDSLEFERFFNKIIEM